MTFTYISTFYHPILVYISYSQWLSQSGGCQKFKKRLYLQLAFNELKCYLEPKLVTVMSVISLFEPYF